MNKRTHSSRLALHLLGDGGEDGQKLVTFLPERRETIRREGKPVRILISSPLLKNTVEFGYVLDRSTGGLRVAMLIAMSMSSATSVLAAPGLPLNPFNNIFVRGTFGSFARIS